MRPSRRSAPQVNISEKARRQITSAISSGAKHLDEGGAEEGGRVLDGHVFDRAQDDVMKLMARDAFVRFKKSPLFCDFMRELGLNSLRSCTQYCMRERPSDAEQGGVRGDLSL